MKINHNLTGLKTFNKLTINAKQSEKSMEKLSSGNRINRAADDAAGSSISEKMRAQIRGLEQAQRNIQDGISFIQSAENGLAKIADPNLQRLRQLSVQASSDTLSSSDRQAIQNEVDQILKGINEIANNTEFNKIPLLNRTINNGPVEEVTVIDGSEMQLTSDSSYDTQPSWVGDKIAFTREANIYTMDSDGKNESLLISGASQPSISNDGSKITYVRSSDNNLYLSNIDGSGEIQLTNTSNVEADSTFGSPIEWSPNGSDIYFKSTNGLEKINITTSSRAVIISDSNSFSPSITPDGYKLVFQKSDGIYIANSDGTESVKLLGVGSLPSVSPDGSKIAFTDYSSETMDNEIFVMNLDGTGVSNITGQMSTASSHNHNIYPTWSPNGEYIVFHSDNVADPSTSGDIWKVGVNIGSESNTSLKGYNIRLQVGANAGNTFDIKLTDARTTALGIADMKVDPWEEAVKSISKLDTAIQKVSSERAKFGSYQNALEYINNNVSNSEINLTAAESRISGVDMANEMIKLTKHNILTQTSQAMLAQANKQPQAILDLLR